MTGSGDTGADSHSHPAADMQGAPAPVVRDAIDRRDPLPGTRGFAGRIDGHLVRDVLGRYPLFTDGGDLASWAVDPSRLSDPQLFPAGHRAAIEDGTASGGNQPGGPERVWTLPHPHPDPDPGSTSLDEDVAAIRGSIEARVGDVDTDGLAIAFSGGVDSAILAALLEVPCYVAGFPDSHDVTAAKTAAARLDSPLTVVDLDHERIEAAIPRVVAATGRTNAMDVAIALPLSCLAERVAADGHDRLALGQGADELFGGYAKVARAPEDPRVEAETVGAARHEVLQSLPAQLPRDVLAIRAGGVEPVLPLLHDDVVGAALALPGDALVTDAGERKWALRLAARAWLPDALAFREKKAMQYGSLVSRELDRLARQAGFKRRMDDHVGKYVESLVA